jgi:hypothetical protein
MKQSTTVRLSSPSSVLTSYIFLTVKDKMANMTNNHVRDELMFADSRRSILTLLASSIPSLPCSLISSLPIYPLSPYHPLQVFFLDLRLARYAKSYT